MTLDRRPGRIRWALYRDAACSDDIPVLSGTLPIDHIRPLELHAIPDLPDSILNVTWIHLAPAIQKHLHIFLAQQRAGTGQSYFSSTNRNNTVPVVVEDLALGARAAKLGLNSKVSLYCKLEFEGDTCEAKDVQNIDWYSWKITRASDFEVRGNEAFKQTNYGIAIRLYKRALAWLKPPVSVSDSQSDVKIQYSRKELQQMNLIAVSCYANLATCFYKSKGNGSVERCIATASSALKLDDAHTKARYYRGLAYVASTDLDLAVCDLTKLCHLEPDNKVFRSALARAQAAKSLLRKKQRIAFTNFFIE